MGAGIAPAAGAAAAPGAGAELDPTLHYAVVVGIDIYPALQPLHAARRDARDFRKWLLRSGVPEENIRLVLTEEDFTDPDAAIPTRKLVDDALEQVQNAVEARIRPDPWRFWRKTRLYLYLSGHGVTPNARDALLLMANAKLGRYGDSIPCSMYMQFYEDVQSFAQLVFLADCCRTLAMQTQPLGPTLDRVTQNRGRVSTFLGFAAGFGELSYEQALTQVQNPDEMRGFFTRALLEGLSGKAVDRATRQINSISLAKYVVQQTMKLTADKKPGPQQPQIVADAGAPIVFVESVPLPTYPVTISFPAGLEGSVTLRDGWEAERGSHQVSSGPWTLELEDGLYEVTMSDGTPLERGVFRVGGGPRRVDL